MTIFQRIAISELVATGEAALKTGPFGTQLKASEYTEAGTPVINVRNIGLGNIKPDKLEFISRETRDRLSSHILRKDDIVFGRKGAVERHVFIRQKQDGWFQGSDCLRLRLASHRVDPQFVSYFFFTSDHQRWMMNQCSHGATMASLNQQIIERIELPAPPLPTQRKIVAILSAYDDLIENNLRRINILEEMAQNLYREWFVKFRFPGHQHVRFTDSPLGRIPEGWKVDTVGEIASNFDRLRKPLSSMQRAVRKGIYPYYGAAKVFDYIDDYIFDGIYLLVAEDGSVVTADRKPVLQYVSGKFWPNNHTHILQGKGSVSTEFLYMVLSEVDITGYITGAAQPKITQANLNRIPVVVAEDRTLQTFNEFIRDVFRQKIVLCEKNEALRRTRDLLLPRLISGEVDVSALAIAVPEEAVT